MQLGQISITLKLGSNGDFYENMLDIPKYEEIEREVKNNMSYSMNEKLKKL